MESIENLYLKVLDTPEWDHLEDWNKNTYALLNDILKAEGIGLVDRITIRRTLKNRQKEIKKERYL